MDYGRAFSYVFEDSEWVNKLLLGGLILLGGVVIIPFFFVLGYVVETIQNVVAGKEKPLPEWDNWGEKLGKGVMLFLIIVIYYLPALAILGLRFGYSVLASVLQMILVGALSAEGGQTLLISQSLQLPRLGLEAIQGIYLLFLAFVFPVIMIQYATTERFEKAFKFKEMYQFIKQNIGDYFIIFILSFVTSFIGFIGTIACCIGVVFTMFYANLINVHLYGQLYKQSRQP